MGDFPGRSGVKPAKMVGKCGKITPIIAVLNPIKKLLEGNERNDPVEESAVAVWYLFK